ncbi:uncharacterized protein LOC119302725 isoform X2 [Triticum dicoccoides]|uniref:uncharacterized protein LOC119302725 isoform X2 n=1 Tax=Triticum dicoccoides TaxID=85692 RepID=UPI00188F1A28|nr:uncharacterized protein LOC119302725 isoform X2 [Triticum dicoccoides]
MVCSVWRCLRGRRRCLVVSLRSLLANSQTVVLRPVKKEFSEGEGGAEGDGSNQSESKKFEAVRRHKSRVLNYVKAMLMCKSLRVTSSMAIIFPPTSFRPWRPGEGGAAAHSTLRCRAAREPGREASMRCRTAREPSSEATMRCRDRGRRAGRRQGC